MESRTIGAGKPAPAFLSLPAAGNYTQRNYKPPPHRYCQATPSKSKLVPVRVLTPLLPCGILYAMLVKAITAGTAIAGAMTMAVYALGMAPALIMVGSLSSVLSTRLRKNAENVAAVIVILMGITLILRGFHVPYVHWLVGGGGQGGHMH